MEGWLAGARVIIGSAFCEGVGEEAGAGAGSSTLQGPGGLVAGGALLAAARYGLGNLKQ